MNAIDFNVSDVISFKYKGGRSVKGEIVSVQPKWIVLRLHTDYIGKNVDWEKGELKDFNIKEIKNLNTIRK